MPDELLDADGFTARFRARAIVVGNLPAGRARDLATAVITTRTDGAVHTGLERRALFGRLLAEFAPGAGELTLTDGAGARTAAGHAVDAYEAVVLDADDFFAEPMHQIHVTGFGRLELGPDKRAAVTAPRGARLAVYPIDPADPRHIPPPGPRSTFFGTADFSLENTGNATIGEPKSSWRAELDLNGTANDSIVGMRTLHLKSMVNDASQVREALAWAAFAAAGVRASRRSYARYAMDAVYRGLYSLTEDVDRRFVRARFGVADRGNVYKCSCGDLGCATLAHRGDSGADYRSPAGSTDETYELRTNEDDPDANTFADLAAFVRAVHGLDLGGAGFDSPAYRGSMEAIFDVRGFLRWAGVNVLLGSWDTYYGTPGNYFLYNSGRAGHERDFMAAPYFTFLPWDYDNILGIRYRSTQGIYRNSDWAGGDIVDWPMSRHTNGRARLPLLVHLLGNTDFLRYYLDHLEHLLDTTFDPATIAARIAPGGLWDRVRRSAYLESDFPGGPQHTRRNFTNHDIWRHTERQEQLRFADRSLDAITTFARRRHDTARAQLAARRAQHPRGSSGGTFPATPDPVP